MGYKLSCITLETLYKDDNDKHIKIKNIYKFIRDFKNIKVLNNNLKPPNWLDTYMYTSHIDDDTNTIVYRSFSYNHIDKKGDYGDREVSIFVHPQYIRFWIGSDATECLDWEHNLFQLLLKSNLIDIIQILKPSSKYSNLSRGTIIGKKNLIIIYEIKKYYRGDKKDIIKFLSKNETTIYKNDKIITINMTDSKKLLIQEKNGLFSQLIKRCFLFKGWFW